MDLKQAANPWTSFDIADYERHMSHENVRQLQMLSQLFKSQYADHLPKKLLYLGMCSGNGLEHIDARVTDTVYGVDINTSFLDVCRARYGASGYNLVLKTIDLNHAFFTDDKVDLIVCNLILEFVDVERFFEQVRLASHDDTVVSLIFQKKNAVQVVSNSGVVAIQKLKDFNQEVKEADIEARIAEHGYQVRSKLKTTLIDGKELIRIDFAKPRAA